MLDRIRAGRGRLQDLELLLEIGDNIGIMPGTTICGLADGAAWPIKNAIRKFRDEFEEYIRRSNPQGYLETEPVPASEHCGSPLDERQIHAPHHIDDQEIEIGPANG